MPSSDFELTCECGYRMTVTAGMAGTSVVCRCGRELTVPGLSQLRQQAGFAPYATSAVEEIAAILNEGQLPSGPNCLECGCPTDETVICEAVCERSWAIRRKDEEQWDFFGFVGHLIGLPIGLPRRRVVIASHGRDTVIRISFRLCDLCQKAVGNLRRQRTLKYLLSRAPIFKQLLDEYPETTVTCIEVGRRV